MKKIISAALVAAMVLSLAIVAMSVPASAEVSVYDGETVATGFGGGSGSAADPYLITNAAELIWFAESSYKNEMLNYKDQFIKLTVDIDLADKNWIPIGYQSERAKNFQGNFDGDGHTIYNFRCSSEVPGLFGYTYLATIKNVAVDFATLKTTARYAGGIVALARSTVVSNCYVGKNVTVTASDTRTQSAQMGGVIGWLGNDGAVAEYCVNNAVVTEGYKQGQASNFIGGIVGVVADTAEVNYCVNNGALNCAVGDNTSKDAVGGIVGALGASGGAGTVSNCVNTAEVNGGCNAGGVIGKFHVAGSTVEKSFNFGKVTGADGLFGSLIGEVAKQNCTAVACVGIDTYTQAAAGLVSSDAAAFLPAGAVVTAEANILTNSDYLAATSEIASKTTTFAEVKLADSYYYDTTIAQQTTVQPTEAGVTTVPQTPDDDTTAGGDGSTTPNDVTSEQLGTVAPTDKVEDDKKGCSGMAFSAIIAAFAVSGLGAAVIIKKYA